MNPDEIKKIMRAKRNKPNERIEYLSTGSTLLNLAFSNKVNGGFRKGLYYYLVGDSSSGKTFMGLTCLAEASQSVRFKDYRFIYDNSENGALMQIEKFFGKKLAERLEPPAKDKEGPVFSSSIEEFYYHVDDAIKQKTPFIYILDSMDSLTSDSEGEKFEEKKNAHRKGKTTAGSYGDGKAKINSQNLRRLMTPLQKSGSILIVIGQTRDNLGFGFKKKTRSGGNAPIFYASMILWSSVYSHIKKVIKGKPRELGVECEVKIEKNREIGALRPVRIQIYHSYGIDDIGSCIDYLIDEGHWSEVKKIIKADEFEFKGKKEALIRLIESKNLQQQLKTIVGDVWSEIEEACQLKRKKRYE